MRAIKIACLIGNDKYYNNLQIELNKFQLSVSFNRFSEIDKLDDSLTSVNPDLIIFEYLEQKKNVDNWINVNSDIIKDIPIILIVSQKAKTDLENILLLGNITTVKNNDVTSLCSLIKFIHTTKKSTEKNQIRSEKNFIKIIEAAKDAVIIANTEGKITICNNQAEKLFGYSKVEMLNMQIAQLVPKKYQKQHTDSFKRFLTSHKPTVIGSTFELEGCKKDGTIIPLNISLSYWENKTKSYFCAIISDITEKKVVIERLKKEHNLLFTLVQNVPSSIYVKEPNGNKILSNSIDKRLEEYTKKITINSKKEPLSKKELEKIDLDILKNGIPILDNECERTLKNNEKRWFLFSKVPVFGDNGEISNIISIEHDISQIKESKHKQQLIIEILQILNSPEIFSEALELSLKKINDLFNFDTIALRLLENNDYPYQASIGLSKNLLESDILVNTKCDKDANHSNCFKCLCGSIIDQTTDKKLPYFTSFGSFFSSDISSIPANFSEQLFNQNLKKRTCKSFNTIAVIPIYLNQKVIGILKLFNEEKNSIDEKTITFFEELSSIYSIAYHKNENQIQLESSEKKFRDLYNNSTACLYRANSEGNILLANPAFISLLGYKSLDQLAKKTNIHLLHYKDKDKDLFWNILDKEGAIFGFKTTWKRDDGSLVHVIENAKIVYNSKKEILYYEGTVDDITEQTISENKLAHSEEQFRLIWQNSLDAMRLLDENGIIVEVNNAFCKLVEKSREELIGKPFSESFLNQESFEEFLISLTLTEDQENLESEIILWNNKRKWVSVSNSHFHISDGIEMLLSIYRDITHSKEKEIELQHAYLKAEKSNKIKSEFLAQMSHEIRTPVNVLDTIYSMIYEEMSLHNNPSITELLNTVKAATYRIIKTFDLILNYSEINSGGYNPVYIDLSLTNDVINREYNVYRKIAEEKKIDFVLNTDNDNCTITADRYSLQQIFDQLLDNAFKFTNKGRISISTLNKGASIFTIIEDSGIGISEEYLDDLYTPFSQEDKGYSREFDGNGLGLALVKKYCELNNIGIEVKSKKGEGTSFILEFSSSIFN